MTSAFARDDARPRATDHRTVRRQRMVLPGKRPASGASNRPPTSLLKKKSSGLQQSRLSFAPGGGTSAGGGSSSSAASGPLRQASLFQLRGVVQYEDEDSSLGVPNTLYLGEADILHLKATLDAASEDREGLLRVLRRLSAVPCTRQVLEATKIGVSVGHLRRHADAEVSELAAKIVAVWKKQLAEHKAQKQATAAHRR